MTANWQRAASLREALDILANGDRRQRRQRLEEQRRQRRDDARQHPAAGIRYDLHATVTVTADTDPGELEALLRAGLAHWVLKNDRDKTLAVVRVEAVESLERLP